MYSNILSKRYYNLSPEVKLLTLNFVDLKDPLKHDPERSLKLLTIKFVDPKDHMSYFDILNKMDITHLISFRIQMDN